MGKILRTQKTDNFFFFSELQEVEVRICVQPNFPIINLILLTAFHEFARSRGANTSGSGSFTGYDMMYVWSFSISINICHHAVQCLSKESKCGVQWLIYWIWQCGGGDRHPPPIAHVLGSTHIVLLYMLIMMMMMMMMMEIVMIVRMSLLATIYTYDSVDHKDDVLWLSSVRKMMLMKKGTEMNKFQDANECQAIVIS